MMAQSFAEFDRLVTDLAKKASDDVRHVIRSTLDLAAMAGGVSAMTSVLIHVAGSDMLSVVTALDMTRSAERGIKADMDAPLSRDDLLFCCLFIAAGYQEDRVPGAIPATAIEMFEKITGKRPDLPMTWMTAIGGGVSR